MHPPLGLEQCNPRQWGPPPHHPSTSYYSNIYGIGLCLQTREFSLFLPPPTPLLINELSWCRVLLSFGYAGSVCLGFESRSSLLGNFSPKCVSGRADGSSSPALETGGHEEKPRKTPGPSTPVRTVSSPLSTSPLLANRMTPDNAETSYIFFPTCHTEGHPQTTT